MPLALLRSWLCTALCVACCCGSAQASEAVSELDLKAAYVLNFIQFIEWPGNDAGADDGWVLCVSPFSPLKRALTALEGRPARKGRPIHVRLLDLAALRECEVLVLHGSDGEPALRALRSLPPANGVLTIAEEPPAAGPEVVISLARQDGRVVFGINAEAAARAGLSVSSRLLRLAKAGR